VATDEMENPEWYPIEAIPLNRLMLADPFWLPRMLSGEKGVVWTEYGPRQETLIGDVVFELVDVLEEE
jgi:hypothetical protein